MTKEARCDGTHPYHPATKEDKAGLQGQCQAAVPARPSRLIQRARDRTQW